MRKPAFIILSVLISAGFSFAQDAGPSGPPPFQPPDAGQPSAQNQPDPPGRVARLNYIQGSVSFEPAGTQQWVDASPNRPLTTGDNLWVDQNSRGEVHVGSTAIRLSAQTGLSILNLNDQAVQIEVPQGSLDLHVRDIADQEAYEVDTPNLAMTILRPGDYRIDVDPDGGSSLITVRSGNAEITAAGTAYNANPGHQYVFAGSDQLTYDARPAPPNDEFDSWAVSRDQLEDRSLSARYVSREVTGYEDLDRYGIWRQDPEYGPVWVPSGVPIGWAPYHYGHWVYVAPWGWTWIEDEPWGFAPFHYGRWALVAGDWAWVPGPVVAVGVRVRPVYAPALVGFVGGGGLGVSFALGGGVAGVAWFPLGPRDVWVPAYRCSPRYVENINITNTRVVNVVQVRNVYVNHTTVINNYTYAHNTVAVTAVSRETFVNGAPVARSTVRVNEQVINHPQVMHEARLEPTSRSAFGSAAGARALPPAALSNRPVVTRMAPSPHAVALGHSQPLIAERTAYRPSNPPNGGQFSHPVPNGNTNPGARSEANHGFEQRPNGNGGFQQHPGQNGVNPPPNANRGFERPSNSNDHGSFQPQPGQNGTGQNVNNASNANRGYRSFEPPNRGGANGNGNANGNANGNVNANINAAGQPHPDAQPRSTMRSNDSFRPSAQPNGNGNSNSQPPAQIQPRPDAQPRSTMRSNDGFRPSAQPNGNGNSNSQPPAQVQPRPDAEPRSTARIYQGVPPSTQPNASRPAQPVQEDRHAQGGNPGNSSVGAGSQSHENTSHNEKQPPKQDNSHGDHGHDR